MGQYEAGIGMKSMGDWMTGLSDTMMKSEQRAEERKQSLEDNFNLWQAKQLWKQKHGKGGGSGSGLDDKTLKLLFNNLGDVAETPASSISTERLGADTLDDPKKFASWILANVFDESAIDSLTKGWSTDNGTSPRIEGIRNRILLQKKTETVKEPLKVPLLNIPIPYTGETKDVYPEEVQVYGGKKSPVSQTPYGEFINQQLQKKTGIKVSPTESTTTSLAKQLDEQTAAEILQEVGGDNNAARALAKQRGYIF